MNRTAIQYDDSVYFARSETVTTWTDDDGIQWVTFVPTNGYNPGKPHRVRTDRVVMVDLGVASDHPPRVSRVVDVADYRTFAQCAREAGLDTLLVNDGTLAAKITGPRDTVDAFLTAAGYSEADWYSVDVAK